MRTTGTTSIICTETHAIHAYSNETYEVMCQYDALQFAGRDGVATIATEDDAEWWHEYERVCEECEKAAENRDLDMWDFAEYVLFVDWFDLSAAMSKIADALGVRGMFIPEADEHTEAAN